MSVIQQIDEGLARYYQRNGRNDYYEDEVGQFTEYCDDNGFDDDDIKEEMQQGAEDCMLVDFDDDFPVAQKSQNRNETIYNIIKIIIDNPNAYKGNAEYDDEKAMNSKMITLRESCNTIFSKGIADKALMTLLYIGEENIGKPYLHLMADVYARDRIKYHLETIKMYGQYENQLSQLPKQERETVSVPTLNVNTWADLNKHTQNMKNYYQKEFDLLKGALQTYYHLLGPLMGLKPTIKIQENYEEICKYISAAVDFVYRLAKDKPHGQQSQLAAICPFQYDFCIAFKDVKESDKIINTKTTDDDDDDDDDDEEKDEMKWEYFDCFGNIKKRLRDANIESHAQEIEIGQKLRFQTVFDAFKQKIITKLKQDEQKRQSELQEKENEFNKNKQRYEKLKVKYELEDLDHEMEEKQKKLNKMEEKEYKEFIQLKKLSQRIDQLKKEKCDEKEINEYPRRFRFLSVLDRRQKNKENETTENDELIFFEARRDCCKIPPQNTNYDDLWYFNSSKTCIIPKAKNYNENDKDKKRKLQTHVINTNHPMKNGMLVLSFHVQTSDEIRCYLYLGSQMMRFLPEDLQLFLPQFFADSDGIKDDKYFNEIINNVKSKLVDLKFDEFYKEYQCNIEDMKKQISNRIQYKIQQISKRYTPQRKQNYGDLHGEKETISTTNAQKKITVRKDADFKKLKRMVVDKLQINDEKNLKIADTNCNKIASKHLNENNSNTETQQMRKNKMNTDPIETVTENSFEAEDDRMNIERLQRGISELTTNLNDGIRNMNLLYKQLIHEEQQFFPTNNNGATTCPSGSESSNNSNKSHGHYDYGQNNSCIGNNQTHNIWNKKQNDKDKQEDDDEQKKNNNYKENNHPSYKQCNHLNECKCCNNIVHRNVQSWIEEIKYLKGVISKQHQFADTIQKQLNYHASIFENIRDRSKSNQKSKGKKNYKKKMQQIEANSSNRPGYDPSPIAKQNIKIEKTLTDKIQTIIKETVSNTFKYLHKSINMQCNDHQVILNDENKDNNYQIINVDFHDKYANPLFCVAGKNQIYKNNHPSNKHYQWILHNKLYTANEFHASQLLPKSSRRKQQFVKQLNSINRIVFNQNKVKNIIKNCKWNQIPVYNNKDKNYKTQRKTLSITQEKLNPIIKNALANTDLSKLIPIVMFDNNSHWIEHIFIVKVEQNIDIGISLRCNIQNSVKITGVHLDKDMIFQQHVLVSPHKCIRNCLDGFICTINDIHVGNPNSLSDQVQNYKLKYKTFKQFVDNCSIVLEKMPEQYNMMQQYNMVQQQAEILIRNDNGEILEFPETSTETSSPSSCIYPIGNHIQSDYGDYCSQSISSMTNTKMDQDNDTITS